MQRALKFGALVLVHVVIATIGTAILSSGIWRAIPIHPYSVSAIVWKESLLSVVCATGIGFSVWRMWRNSEAKYTWVPVTAWFVFGLAAAAGHGDLMGRFFPTGNGGNSTVPEIRSFVMFTAPLIRAIFYSLAAYLSSRL
jgi:hypothetical protein